MSQYISSAEEVRNSDLDPRVNFAVNPSTLGCDGPAPRRGAEVIAFPRRDLTDAGLAAGVDAFLKLSPAQQKAFIFRARLAGRSTSEAFNRPPRLVSLSAAHAGDAENQFREAAAQHGLIIKRLIADGKIHRCDVEGKGGKGDGAYLLHLDDFPAGGFQNHRDGKGWQNWRADIGRELTAEEKTAYAAKMEADRIKREADLAKRQADTAKRAVAIVDRCEDAPADHPYFVKKGIKPPREVRYSKAPVAISSWRDSKPNVLIVPMRDINGTLWSVQVIDAEGHKDFLAGSRVKGCFFAIGKIGAVFTEAGPNPNGLNLICEGLATAESCFEAVDAPAVAAFDCGNLEAVARALKGALPKADFIIAADDDWRTKDPISEKLSNPGKTKGKAAAEAICAGFAFPVFNPDRTRDDKWTDFNDLHQAEGLEMVARDIDAAIKTPKLVVNNVVDLKSGKPRRKTPIPAEVKVAQVDDTAVMERLNKDHAFVMLNGQAIIINRIGLGRFSYSRIEDFFHCYANEFMPPMGPKDKPQTIARYWFENPLRRQYKGVEFAIDNPTPGYFNLWEGFAVEATESGKCGLFFDYILDVVCSGDTALYKWVVGWLAHIVQKPEEKGGVALVLRGLQGTGKTLLGDVFKKLLPSNSVILSSPDELLGAFNAHLQSALFVQVEEAFWAGSKLAEGKLKTLITSPMIGIHPKFVNRFEVRNYSRFLVTSNEDWVIPAGFHERRFTVVDVSPMHLQEHSYFAAILAQLEDGGYGRLMWELQRHDLSEFNPRQHHHTLALDDQIRESFKPVERFVCELLEAGKVPNGVYRPWGHNGGGTSVECDAFYADYRQFEQAYNNKYPTDPRTFGKKLKQLLGVKRIRKRVTVVKGAVEVSERQYFYDFPDLETCQAKFKKASAVKTVVFTQEIDDEVNDKD